MIPAVQYIVDSPWLIELLGGIQARRGSDIVTRFQTQKTATLLAYLAYHRRRSPTREELIEVLWPEGDFDAGRHRLNQALSSLRNQLEPPGVPKGAVLTSDRFSIGLNRLGAVTDVEEFEIHLAAADRSSDPDAKLEELQAAIELYRGEFVTGIYDAWASTERQRLSDQYSTALRKGCELAIKSGHIDTALSCANRLVALDPLIEESHQQLMRLYVQVEQPEAAMRQYETLRTLLDEELSDIPSKESDEILREARQTKAVKPQAFAFPMASIAQAKAKPVRTRAELKPVSKLPIQFTRFFGREKELDLASQLLLRPDIRLITINGPGGCGKTRFSIELARNFAEQAGFSTWFVPLADISDAKLIPDRILEVLPQSRSVGTALERITETLSAFPSLLILDNFEHLVEDGARTVRALLEHAVGLKCVVSSRDQLFLEGEQEFRLEPLPCPPPKSRTPLTRAELYSYPSVQLFVDRAQKVKPEFQITDRNASAIADLCARLEGIPLAIELAAEWSETVSPSQLAEKLAHRFAMLISRRRDIDPRHRTLRAAIDYSYSRLRPDAQQLFRHVSIFRGGFTEGAAQSVCPDVACSAELNHILSKSLITLERNADPIRYRMLETVREYALEQLSDEETIAAQDRHLQYYANAVGQKELFDPSIFDQFEMFGAEIDNLRSALRWSLDSDQVGPGLGMASTLAWYWSYRLGNEEGLQWLTELLDAAGNNPSLKSLIATSLNAAGNVSLNPSMSYPFYVRALAIREELGAESAVISTMINLGICMSQLGRFDEAKEHFETAIARAQKIGDDTRCCRVMVNLALLQVRRDNRAEARTMYESALTLSRAQGDRQAEGCALYGLGVILFLSEDFERSRIYFGQSIETLAAIGDDKARVAATVYHCWIDLINGDTECAKTLLQLLEEEQSSLSSTGSCVFYLCAVLAAYQNDDELAAMFIGFEKSIDDKRQCTGAGLSNFSQFESIEVMRGAFRELLQKRLGSQKYQLLKLNGATKQLSEISSWARNLCNETIAWQMQQISLK